MGDQLQGTTAVVTGASSGIGEAVTRALVAQGATVAALARRRDRLESLAADLGDAIVVTEADVTDDDAVRAAVDRIAADHGGIGMLVNNAGYGAWSPALSADLGQWRRMVEVNLTAVLATSHAALPHLVEAAMGARGVADLVSISSIAGRKVPGPNSNVYAATKHGVGAFSEALRVELAERHVRVGLVEPGIVTSEMTTSGARFAPDARDAGEYRALDPAAIADAVLYMVTRPRGVAVHEMLVRPTEQER